jgi:hypothetical protein
MAQAGCQEGDGMMPPWLLDKLESCPSAGNGVNNWLFDTARNLSVHLSSQEIFELLWQKTRHCGRVVTAKEIKRQIECSRKAAWTPDHPEAFAHADDLQLHEISTHPTPTAWPNPNLEAISAIVDGRAGLVDLWEASPVRLDAKRQTEEIIDLIFPGDPLLCCGLSNKKFATRSRSTWRGHLHRYALIAPNPMVTINGHTKDDGHLSEHTLEATAAWVYLVVEFDFSEFARDGKTPAIWAPLVGDWKSKGITVADACAALHLHLARRFPLVLAVHSGGKSIHGWYYAYRHSRNALRAFMEYAVSLGADKATWTRSQFVRMPDGTRQQNGARQTPYYFDPGKAVKL